jgi:hypothetical protein
MYKREHTGVHLLYEPLKPPSTGQEICILPIVSRAALGFTQPHIH